MQMFKEADEESERRVAKLQEMSAAVSKPSESGIGAAISPSELSAAYASEIGRVREEVTSTMDACNKVADNAQKIKTEAQIDLDNCLPFLEQCVRGLQNITKAELHDMKHFAKPPDVIMEVLKAV